VFAAVALCPFPAQSRSVLILPAAIPVAIKQLAAHAFAVVDNAGGLSGGAIKLGSIPSAVKENLLRLRLGVGDEVALRLE
jgi:hypothetical protein